MGLPGGHRGSGDPSPGESDAAVEPLVRRAAALRVKYKRSGGPIRIPVEQVGFHPSNRDGQPPNGARCVELCKEILKIGFDREEADNGGVVVAQKPGSPALHDFNQKACDGEAYLAPVVTGFIAFGSLSHSHLHQILKNVRGSARADIPGVCGHDGMFALDKLRTVDPAFSTAVDSGLMWEVLDWRIEDEEPDGCSTIQAALNAKNGLFLLTHEMQAVAKLTTITFSLAAAERTISASLAQARLRVTLPAFADDEHFLELYRFIVDLGGDGAPFIQDLRSFHERFVDPKVRKIRLSVFGCMNLLALDMPHLKVAGVKFVYSCDQKLLKHGFCEAVSIKHVRDLMVKHSEVAKQAETVLNFFHGQCTRHCGLPAFGSDLIKLFANLDRDVFGIAVGARADLASMDSRIEAIYHFGGLVHRRLQGMCRGFEVEAYPFPWNSAPVVAETQGPSRQLQPKLIQFQDGKPMTQQDSIVQGFVTELFCWSDFMGNLNVESALRDEAFKIAVSSAVFRFSLAKIGFVYLRSWGICVAQGQVGQ